MAKHLSFIGSVDAVRCAAARANATGKKYCVVMLGGLLAVKSLKVALSAGEQPLEVCCPGGVVA